MLFAMLGASITETLTVGEVICTLEKFKLPQNVVIPFTVTLRFLPTVKQEFSYIEESMSIRGIETNFKGFLKHPIKWGEYMLVPILMRSFKIADELSAAAFLALGTIYMVIVAKVKKRGTYLICGLLMSIIGLIGGRINTTLGCIAGGIVAELLVGNYTSIKRIIIAYCSYAVGMALGIYLPAFIMGVNYLQSLKVM